MALQRLFYTEIGSIDQYAKRNNNVLLQAHAIVAKNRGSLSLEIDLITFGENAQGGKEKEERITHAIKLAEHAMQVFLMNKLTGPAYTILCLASELHTILTQWYNLNSSSSDQLIVENLQTLETELELPPHQSSVTGLIQLQKKPETPDMDISSGMSRLLQLNSEQIENIAKTTMRSQKFPNAKMEYVLTELYSFKSFYQRCADPNIQPKVTTLPANFTYDVPPMYYLHNTNTNLKSAENSDMDALLSSWGF